jgi:hypothetical protein
MTVIKNHFEVFLVTSKKQGNGIIESKVGLYIFNKGQFTHICQLKVSCGQDSVSGIVPKVCLNSKFPPTLHSTFEIQPATLFGEKCVRLYLLGYLSISGFTTSCNLQLKILE